jgi:hypothetical protein
MRENEEKENEKENEKLFFKPKYLQLKRVEVVRCDASFSSIEKIIRLIEPDFFESKSKIEIHEILEDYFISLTRLNGFMFKQKNGIYKTIKLDHVVCKDSDNEIFIYPLNIFAFFYDTNF